MVLVNQNCRFLAIWLQSSLYNTKIEDLVTIGNKIFVSSSIDPLLILIQLEDLIQFKKKIMLRDFIIPIFYSILNCPLDKNRENVYSSSNMLLREKGLNPF